MRYTCDGKQDCPRGDDEQGCYNRKCRGLFRCQLSDKCLHYYDFEDGKVDCREGDDEMFVDIPACPMGCDCLMNTMTCISISTTLWFGDKTFM